MAIKQLGIVECHNHPHENSVAVWCYLCEQACYVERELLAESSKASQENGITNRNLCCACVRVIIINNLNRAGAGSSDIVRKVEELINRHGEK